VLGDPASAIRVLAISIEKGFFAFPYFSRDPLLARLHNERDFSRLIDKARTRHEAFRKAFF